jgi:uncharacterized phiE125 gp8 family phage protein
MQRRIVEPADVSGDALSELKSWLGITRPNEDALLADLLQTGLAMCEAFTGQAPLSQLVEERLSTKSGVSVLSSRPVTSVTGLELVSQEGARAPLAGAQFEAEISPEGALSITLLQDLHGQSVTVIARVGSSDDWNSVPAALKQGIIRLCAHYYRDRDRPGEPGKASSPPAIVSALWRPYQTLRLT